MSNDNVPRLNPADREIVLVNVLENALSNKRVACRLPAFISSDPELWFSLVERSFPASGVQRTGYSISELTESRRTVAAITPSMPEPLVEQFKQLFVTMREEIASLRREVSIISNREPRPRGKSDSRSRSRSRYRRRYAGKGVCWYYARFGPQATRCTQPCTYNTRNAEGSR